VNYKLNTPKVQEYVKANLKSNIASLILKGSPFKDIDVQELAQQIEGKKKAEKKLPLWFKTDAIFYPKKINLEQTSSEATALYKSELINGDSLIDLTGGFGIDCTYFSKKIKQVYHCEMNEILSEIVAYNCKVFGITNIKTLIGDSLESIKKLNLNFDWIYIDPSRRSDSKGKVFLLDECIPNVPTNLEFLFHYSNHILIKNSPILDITSTINELKFVKEIHVVAVANEVKELLFLLEKQYTGPIKIKTINILKNSKQYFNFNYGSTTLASYSFPKSYLYEPNAAIMKSGGFQEVSSQFDLKKLHQHTHLYTSNIFFKNFPGRSFKIDHILKYDKKKLFEILPDKKANITTRNFPETVAQIRKKTKIKEGGIHYLFFTTDFENRKIVLVCSKL